MALLTKILLLLYMVIDYTSSAPEARFNVNIDINIKEGSSIGNGDDAVFGAQQCEWNMHEEFVPLVFYDGGYLVYPQGDDRIFRVPEDMPLNFDCPGTGNMIKNFGKQGIRGTCQQLTKQVLKTMGCQKKIESSIKNLATTCTKPLAHGIPGNQGILYYIGFETIIDFLPLIHICFDVTMETTIYSLNMLHGNNLEAKHQPLGESKWKDAEYFKRFNINEIYLRKSQAALILEKLDDKTLAGQFGGPTGELYFAKGHMAPRADFITKAEQDASYHYINAVPQWQAVNNGNWVAIENGTRSLAKTRRTVLNIYSGGLDVLTLPSTKQIEESIFLGNFKSGPNKVPAPKITWKIVHEKTSNAAVGFYVFNNPLLHTDPICPFVNICYQILKDPQWKWTSKFKPYDRNKGFTCCGTIQNLRSVVPYIPDIGNVTLFNE